MHQGSVPYLTGFLVGPDPGGETRPECRPYFIFTAGTFKTLARNLLILFMQDETILKKGKRCVI